MTAIDRPAQAAPPGQVGSPSPAHQATQVPTGAPLSWSAAAGASSYRVHFGLTAPGGYRGTQASTTFNPGPLRDGAVYHWRIDSVNNDGITTGPVWSFQTSPIAIAADFDGDGDVDLTDFGAFQACLAGSGVSVIDGPCVAADLDGDRDADVLDLNAFVYCLSGQTLPRPNDCTVPTGSDPIPPRPANAVTGSALLGQISGLSLTAREQRIRDEILTCNIPDFLRGFVPVTVSATLNGSPRSVTYQVMPDYLAIGSDGDFFRMPMTPDTAQLIADRFECMLTTRKMCNDIYTAAAVKLAPSPINPNTTDITLVTTFYQHQQTIEQQRAGHALGLLVGGIKKDVVVTPQLASKPGKVAIYGWHQLNGTPIQPLYLGHTESWVDYSHGIRLVRAVMTVDGVPMTADDILRDPVLCGLLSDEGVLMNPRYD